MKYTCVNSCGNFKETFFKISLTVWSSLDVKSEELFTMGSQGVVHGQDRSRSIHGHELVEIGGRRRRCGDPTRRFCV